MLRLTWLPYALAAQLGLLMAAWRSGISPTAGLSLASASAITLYLLWALSRHKSAILDTPTSRVASAAKGYVELAGVADADRDASLYSKLTGMPCLWFEYKVEQRRDHRWVTIDGGRSDTRFRLRDDSGSCVIDPAGGEILPRRRDSWVKGGYRYSEALLLKGDPVYALGSLTIEGGAAHAPSQRALQGDLLRQWKRDQTTLLARFDLDGSGHLDDAEWDLARCAAHRDANAQLSGQLARRGEPVLGRPADGRPFVVASGSPDQLARRYVLWFRLQAALLIVTGAGWVLWLHGVGVQ